MRFAAKSTNASGVYHLPRAQVTCATDPASDCCRSCGPTEVCPFIHVQRADRYESLGTVGGGQLRRGFSHYGAAGTFYLDCQVSDWWKAEIDVID